MKRFILLIVMVLAVSAAPLYAEVVETGWISGQVMIKEGGPLSNGMVVFFKADEGPVPDPNRYLRIPDEVSDLDAEGKFRLVLPVGKYFLAAIKRLSGEVIGPPRDGDYFFISQDNEGVPLVYMIENGRSMSVGVISEAVPFKRAVPAGTPGISGTIYDLNGNPVEGAIVFAYFTETMTGLPPFTSYRTGKDGRYMINVSGGGNYYLRVRDLYGGGPPVPGAVMGNYGEEKPAAVEVKAGEVTEGVDVKIVKHVQRGPRGQEIKEESVEELREKLLKQMKEEMKRNSR